jgi:hypothetical protein
MDTPYYVKAWALGVPAYLIGVHLWTWILTASVFLQGAADFRSFYAAGWAIRLGQASELYDLDFQQRLQDLHVGSVGIMLPFTHPPFEALLFEPLSLLDYRHAYLLFLLLNIGALSLTFWLIRPWMRNLSRIYWWLPLALFLAFLPVAAALLQGQDSLLLLTLLAGAAVALDRNCEGTAGLLVGLGLFRFQLTLPIALLFLLWRRWRFLAGFTAAGIVLAGLSVWLMGASVLSYPRTLLNLSLRFQSPLNQAKYAAPVPVAMMPNLRGLIVGMTHTSGFWLHALLLVISSALLWLAARVKTEGRDSLLLAIAVSVPISYHLLIHDLSVLLLPLVVALDKVGESETSGASQDRLAVRLAVAAFIAPLLISYAPDHFWAACIPLLAFAIIQCVSENNKTVHPDVGHVGLSFAQSNPTPKDD